MHHVSLLQHYFVLVIAWWLATTHLSSAYEYCHLNQAVTKITCWWYTLWSFHATRWKIIICVASNQESSKNGALFIGMVSYVIVCCVMLIWLLIEIIILFSLVNVETPGSGVARRTKTWAMRWIARLVYIYIQYIQNFDPYLNTLWLFNSVTVCELEAMAHL